MRALGKIHNCQWFLSFIGFDVKKNEILQLMREYDRDDTGRIEYQDFNDISDFNKFKFFNFQQWHTNTLNETLRKKSLRHLSFLTTTTLVKSTCRIYEEWQESWEKILQMTNCRRWLMNLIKTRMGKLIEMNSYRLCHRHQSTDFENKIIWWFVFDSSEFKIFNWQIIKNWL